MEIKEINLNQHKTFFRLSQFLFWYTLINNRIQLTKFMFVLIKKLNLE